MAGESSRTLAKSTVAKATKAAALYTDDDLTMFYTCKSVYVTAVVSLDDP